MDAIDASDATRHNETQLKLEDDQSEARRFRDGFRTAVRAQLAEDGTDVELHRVLTDAQLARDLPVGQTSGQPLQDLLFTRGQFLHRDVRILTPPWRNRWSKCRIDGHQALHYRSQRRQERRAADITRESASGAGGHRLEIRVSLSPNTITGASRSCSAGSPAGVCTALLPRSHTMTS